MYEEKLLDEYGLGERAKDWIERNEETDDGYDGTTDGNYYEEENEGNWNQREMTDEEYDEEYDLADKNEGKKENKFLFYGGINSNY